MMDLLAKCQTPDLIRAARCCFMISIRFPIPMKIRVPWCHGPVLTACPFYFPGMEIRSARKRSSIFIRGYPLMCGMRRTMVQKPETAMNFWIISGRGLFWFPPDDIIIISIHPKKPYSDCWSVIFLILTPPRKGIWPLSPCRLEIYFIRLMDE